MFRRGTRSCVSRSAGDSHEWDACRDLHRDIRMPQGMDRPVRKAGFLADLMHPIINRAGV